MTQPPGWYRDHTDPALERWWDGVAWGQATRPLSGLPVPPPTAPAPYGAPKGSPGGSPQGTPYQSFYQPYQPDQPDQPDQPYQTQPGMAQVPAYGAVGFPGYPPGATTVDGVPLGSRGARFGGALLDGLITGAIGSLLALPWAGELLRAFRTFIDQTTTWYQQHPGLPPPESITRDFASAVQWPALVITLIGMTIAVLYHTIFIALRNTTPGKTAAGLRVRPAAAEGAVGWQRALLRAAATQLPRIVPYAGQPYVLLDDLWCTWDPQRQCLHDKIAKTVVVRRRP